MYVIAGATGNTGGRIASNLLAAGKEVTVVGRSVEKLQTWANAGAKMAAGDLQDVTFMTEILKGAEAAYLLIPPNFATEDFRDYQMRTADALTSAVKASGLKKVVILSSVGAHLAEDSGVILGLHYFEQSLKLIEGLDDLALRAGIFMKNFL